MEIKKDDKKKSKVDSKLVIIPLVVVVLAVVLGLLVSFGKGDNQNELEKSLKEMGKNFYENFYYEQIGTSADERTKLLSKFTTVGIKVDLENLSRYNDGEFKDEIKKFKNKKTDKSCNRTNTKVVIYPKSPYGKTDYSVEAELDCGFSKDK